jgi:hypothetical protein
MAIVGEAHIVVRAITTGFQRDVENSLKDVNGSVKNIGQDIGKDFSKSVSKGMGGGGAGGAFSKFNKEAETLIVLPKTNWQNALFGQLVQAIEMTAMQRGVHRY